MGNKFKELDTKTKTKTDTEKDFIPFEQALAMKELDFDEPCVAKYSLGIEKDNYTELQYHLDYSQAYGDRGVFIPIVDNFLPIKLRNSEHSHVPSAPLYQQTFRWFRKNHGLFGTVTPMNRFLILNPSDKSFKTIEGNLCATYEQAEYECLKKLIKILKKRKIENK